MFYSSENNWTTLKKLSGKIYTLMKREASKGFLSVFTHFWKQFQIFKIKCMAVFLLFRNFISEDTLTTALFVLGFEDKDSCSRTVWILKEIEQTAKSTKSWKNKWSMKFWLIIFKIEIEILLSNEYE